MPGGTQLACGESCGGLDWNSLSMAAYLGVSEGCSATAPPRRPPKDISHTPFKSGSCAIEAHVPPGNLLASAAIAREPRPITLKPIEERSRARLSINKFPSIDTTTYNACKTRQVPRRLLRAAPGGKMILGIHFEII